MSKLGNVGAPWFVSYGGAEIKFPVIRWEIPVMVQKIPCYGPKNSLLFL